MSHKMPVSREISYLDPVLYATQWAHHPWTLWLDSASRNDPRGRYSFLAVEPAMTLVLRGDTLTIEQEGMSRVEEGDPFEILEDLWRSLQRPCDPELPPFQGGFAGYFSYDLARAVEKLPTWAKDDVGYPEVMLGVYEKVLAFDHATQRCWAFAKDEQQLISWLEELAPCEPPSFEGKGLTWSSNFTQEAYEAAVSRVIDYIWAGDIFQANLSQRFEATLPSEWSSFAHYCHLRLVNPAPFAAYLNFGPWVLSSSSPERFLWARDGLVETRPIKGTRPRVTDEDMDQRYREELMSSAKDRAENAMIVDLMRNDISRVCEDLSVKVPDLCRLESFATVHHLVSAVVGRLRPDASTWSLLRASFPGGSISGAPKVRAMEIIEELEPTRRGPYCGCIGYLGWDGSLDTNIAIRTLVATGGMIRFQVGGGIVADSVPAQEYQETLDKGRALFASFSDLTPASVSTSFSSKAPAGLSPLAVELQRESCQKDEYKGLDEASFSPKEQGLPFLRHGASSQDAPYLLIDNYDSFVYNLARYLGRLGISRRVVRNDAMTLQEVEAMDPAAIILSPGPCAPEQAGISLDIVKHFGPKIPILGVCLGHQCMGQIYGGRVERAIRPIHGQTSVITHQETGLFAGLPPLLEVARYHSLIVLAQEGAAFEVTAQSRDGEIMALQHRAFPSYGVQFHPESVLMPDGVAMIANFVSLAQAWNQAHRSVETEK
ncbi:MAG: aminodeoxychorismate synthase component I [Myxococcales bacterium]|nr:aminodeoxychorismate synthase component I [Myxococcales bacterium]